MKKKINALLLLIACTAPFAEAQIDRKSVVERHRVVSTRNNPQSPAQVGNGEFAFGVDITGLQTFDPHYTMSHWSWHSFPIPEGMKPEEFKGEVWDTHGRPVTYCTGNKDQPELSAWLCGNPHRFNLGRVGLVLLKSNGERAVLNDLAQTRQELDLWQGIITSRFTLEGVPVKVTTLCHATADVVGVEIESPLIGQRRLQIEYTFPSPDRSQQVRNLMDAPSSHTTRVIAQTDRQVRLNRAMDDARYTVSVGWEGAARWESSTEAHTYRLVPSGGETLRMVCGFTPDATAPEFSFAECRNSSVGGWEHYWQSGASLDLSESKDPRWRELERRIVLSQYLMKANEAGSLPPQESGLVNNGWFGRFHFEMIWWHGVHYALWNRWELLDPSLAVFRNFLPTSVRRASQQGYAGARWPKCTADFDRDWPHPIHAALIWQQPHPIYFAEEEYRLRPTRQTLDKWKEVVRQSAEFMADYARQGEKEGRYVLGPPVHIVSENTDPHSTTNPAFELAYWRYGLETAQRWNERIEGKRNKQWDEVLKRLSPLPVQEGLYVSHEGIKEMWTKFNFEHPGLTGIRGMLPGCGVDRQLFDRTLDKVVQVWNFDRTWGWDFPMVAMAAARSGKPDLAVDLLLHPSKGFQFDEHGLATGGPFPYFPSNGALLTAVAMMVAGWDGEEDDAPGFPRNGEWTVKHEGFRKMQ